MDAVIVTGGNGPVKERVLDYVPAGLTVIAADSGYDYALELGLTVDRVIGDMDSVTAPLPSGALVYPRHKDFSDTELAFNLLVGEGYGNIGIIGGGGGRMDHFLMIWAMMHRDPAPEIWLTPGEEIRLIKKDTVFYGPKGRYVSFFPAGANRMEARTEGLKWPLDGLSWSVGDGGLSNESVADSLKIHMIRGKLIMIQSIEGPRFHE